VAPTRVRQRNAGAGQVIGTGAEGLNEGSGPSPRGPLQARRMSPARRVVGPNECWTHEQQRRPQPGDRRFTETRRGVRGRGPRRAFKRSGPSPLRNRPPQGRRPAVRSARGLPWGAGPTALLDRPSNRRLPAMGTRDPSRSGTGLAGDGALLDPRDAFQRAPAMFPTCSRVGKSSARQPDPTRPENRFVEPKSLQIRHS
jgi:hypothetical protein